MKSTDDQYLMHAVCLSIANNDTAFRHFATKIMRSTEKAPGLMKALLRSKVPVLSVDERGNEQETLAVRINSERMYQCADNMARALYFHRYDKRFEGKTAVMDDFTLNLDIAATQESEDMLAEMKKYFSKLPWNGENPDVFQYQLHHDEQSKCHLGVLQFYGATHFYLVYTPD